jgi:hypothetical protein
MQTRVLLAMVLGLAAAVPAAAQDHPAVMRPSRDVMVEYHVGGVSNGQQRSDTVRMYFADQGSKLRIEPVGQPGYSIVDRNAARMIIVMAPQHAYLEMPYDAKKVMSFDDKDTTFTRRGTDTVAGIGCTIYDAKRQDHSGQVCLSDDGLLLRTKGDDPAHGNGELEAVKVAYGPQSPSLFVPPPDFRKMDMSTMGRGAPGSGH